MPCESHPVYPSRQTFPSVESGLYNTFFGLLLAPPFNFLRECFLQHFFSAPFRPLKSCSIFKSILTHIITQQGTSKRSPAPTLPRRRNARERRQHEEIRSHRHHLRTSRLRTTLLHHNELHTQRGMGMAGVRR